MNLQELEDIYQKFQREMKTLLVSPTAFKFIRDSKTDTFGITYHVSPLFPFEIMWDACDVETKEGVKIPSGEWVHAIAFGAPDPVEDISFLPDLESNIQAWNYRLYWGYPFYKL